MLLEYECSISAQGLTNIRRVEVLRPKQAVRGELRLWAVLDRDDAHRLQLELALGNQARAMRLLNDLAHSCGTDYR